MVVIWTFISLFVGEKDPKFQLGEFITYILPLVPLMGEASFYFIMSQRGSCQASDRDRTVLEQLLGAGRHPGLGVSGVIASMRTLSVVDCVRPGGGRW